MSWRKYVTILYNKEKTKMLQRLVTRYAGIVLSRIAANQAKRLVNLSTYKYKKDAHFLPFRRLKRVYL